MEQIERTMKSDKIFDGKILSLRVDTVELPDKKYSKREIVEHDPSVSVVATDNDGNILLVKQYRKPVEKVIYEIPAGSIEIGENPREGAIRELKEETGYVAKDVEYISEFYSTPGFCTEKMYVFFATEIEECDQEPDEDEFIEVEKVSLDKAIKMIQLGEIMDAKSIVGILMYEKYKRGEK